MRTHRLAIAVRMTLTMSATMAATMMLASQAERAFAGGACAG